MKRLLLLLFIILNMTSTEAQNTCSGPRKMWASINNIKNASLGDYQAQTGKVLISWRMLPSDNWDTSFLLYSQQKNGGTLTKVTPSPIVNSTCYQLPAIPNSATIYYLIKGDVSDAPASISETADINAFLSANCTDQMELASRIYSEKLPYLTIPLRDTHSDVCSIDTVFYQANDVSVGDLDGDGEAEIVVKRLQTVKDRNGNLLSDGTGASVTHRGTTHAVIWDAYKLDGTLMWRIKGGPAVMLGNGTAFAVADFDGDGKCEMAIRTGEGTVFGDGTMIGDTNGDGKTDYRTWGQGYTDNYNSAGPEFLSIIDGTTGRELARTNFINRDTSESWGDGYWKRSNSFRIGAACFDKTGLPSVVIGRGVYARSVIEAWDYRNGNLTRRWHVDTSDSWTGKDGNPSSAYAGQGNHAFNAADLDGDGFDEIMYGSMAIDHDGIGLWTTKLGHGDANHVGKFLPDREGMQVYHCLESGKTQVALHDAATGAVIWKKEGTADNDMGRCLVADIDPSSPGCEFWMFGSNAYSQDGNNDLGYKPSSCNMAIWFDGSLSRQLINENIIHSQTNGRTFTMYRYDETFINGTKSNPSWYGDIFGDWREEVILPDASKLNNLKIFSTWYPSDYKFPYLMSDHNYYMQTINQNIGYNQPNHLSYFLGTGMDMSKVPVGIKEDDINADFMQLPAPSIVRTGWNETGINVLYPTVSFDVRPVVINGIVKKPTLTALFEGIDGSTTTVGSASYHQDYNNVSQAEGWTVSNNASILSIADNNDNYGKHLMLSLGNSSSRWAYTRLEGLNLAAANNYTIEFDLALTAGNKDAGTEFCVFSKGGTMPTTYWHNYVYNTNNKQNFLFDITGTAKSSAQYYLNGTKDDESPSTTTLNAGTWYHYTLKVDKKARTVSWSISNGASGTFTPTEGTNMEIGGFCLLAARNQAVIRLDNLNIYQTETPLFTEDYEQTVNASSWAMNYNGIIGTLELVSNDNSYNGGKYIKYSQSGNGQRSVYTRFYENGNNPYEGNDTYRLEFDTKLKQSSGSGNNIVVVYQEGAAMPKGNNAWNGDGWLFKLHGGNNSTSYFVDHGNGNTSELSLNNETWYHFALEIHKSTRVVSYAITAMDGTDVAQGQYLTGAIGTQLNAQGIVFTCGRNGSYAAIDNIDCHIPTGLHSFTFDQPGTLTVTASVAGQQSKQTVYSSEIGTRINELGYSTLSYPNCGLDFSQAGNVQVYTVKVDNSHSVTTTEVSSNIVPSGNAVLLKGVEGMSGIYVATICDDDEPLPNNDLQPVTYTMNGSSGNIYVLNKVNGKVGFYKLNADGQISAGKGYLSIGGTLVKEMPDYAELDEPTSVNGIENADFPSTNTIVYDLSGRKVEKPGKGIYIVNGKKVIIK